MGSDSLIFLPTGGGGEFLDFANAIRAHSPVPTSSLVVPIQHSHVEWSGIEATHIGLEALSVRGHFLPLVLLPLQPFVDERDQNREVFRYQPLLRLSWYGHPVGSIEANIMGTGKSPHE